LIRRVRAGPNAPEGTEAGWQESNYKRVKIEGQCFLVHRVIFFIHNGHLPDVVDHIDGNSLNNNPYNLREATNGQNRMNTKSNKNSSSKYKGVGWNKSSGKWAARFRLESVEKHLGYFEDEFEAALAVDRANREHNLEFSTFNCPVHGERSAL